MAHRQRSRRDAQGHAQAQPHQILQCHNVVDLLLPIYQAGRIVFALQHAQINSTVACIRAHPTAPVKHRPWGAASDRAKRTKTRRVAAKAEKGGKRGRRVWGCA